jgi:hypothetical protein
MTPQTNQVLLDKLAAAGVRLTQQPDGWHASDGREGSFGPEPTAEGCIAAYVGRLLERYADVQEGFEVATAELHAAQAELRAHGRRRPGYGELMQGIAHIPYDFTARAPHDSPTSTPLDERIDIEN